MIKWRIAISNYLKELAEKNEPSVQNLLFLLLHKKSSRVILPTLVIVRV